RLGGGEWVVKGGRPFRGRLGAGVVVGPPGGGMAPSICNEPPAATSAVAPAWRVKTPVRSSRLLAARLKSPVLLPPVTLPEAVVSTVKEPSLVRPPVMLSVPLFTSIGPVLSKGAATVEGELPSPDLTTSPALLNWPVAKELLSDPVPSRVRVPAAWLLKTALLSMLRLPPLSAWAVPALSRIRPFSDGPEKGLPPNSAVPL